MRIRKYIPLVLAVLVFVISNIIDRSLSSRKESLVQKVSTIEKNLTSFLQYNFLAASNYNFAQLHLNSVVESTLSQQHDARKIYMSNVADQLARAISAFDDAATRLDEKTSSEDKDLINNLKNAGDQNSFNGFFDNYQLAIQRTKELQNEVSEKIKLLSQEKIRAQSQVAEIDSKQSILFSITIAINFLILLFEYIEKQEKKISLIEE